MRVLLLGTVRPGHDVLKDMGHEIVLFLNINSAIPADLKFGYHAISYFADNHNEEEFVAQAYAIHKNNPFNAICCLHDDMQSIGIKIAKKRLYVK